jgi:hypothetical protein
MGHRLALPFDAFRRLLFLRYTNAATCLRRGRLAAFNVHRLAERTTAISTEFRAQGIVRITFGTAIRQRASALGTEFLADNSFCPALRAAHSMFLTQSSSALASFKSAVSKPSVNQL